MNRTGNNLTVVCYDITSDKLRRNIDKCMKDFGQRLQFSVFLCRIDATDAAHMREKLLAIVKNYHNEREPDDSLIIFERFSPDTADCILGTRIERELPTFEIF